MLYQRFVFLQEKNPRYFLNNVSCTLSSLMSYSFNLKSFRFSMASRKVHSVASRACSKFQEKVHSVASRGKFQKKVHSVAEAIAPFPPTPPGSPRKSDHSSFTTSKCGTSNSRAKLLTDVQNLYLTCKTRG